MVEQHERQRAAGDGQEAVAGDLEGRERLLGAQYGEASALAVTSLVPSIILGMLVQRHAVRGRTLGAVQR